MSPRGQRACVWAGLAMMPLFFLGFALFAGFVPPPSPADSAQEVARMFDDDRTGIRIGMFIATAAGALLCFLFAAIAIQLRRMEGEGSILAQTQVIAGACTVLEFIVPPVIWQAAAFRAERAPEDVQLLNDLAWLPFLGITGTLIIQQVVIAIAILRDRRETPVMPRWVGYANLWAAVGIAPASFVVFFHTGPLAWNGVLAWWVVLLDFFAWLCVMGWALFRAIDHQEEEERSLPASI